MIIIKWSITSIQDLSFIKWIEVFHRCSGEIGQDMKEPEDKNASLAEVEDHLILLTTTGMYWMIALIVYSFFSSMGLSHSAQF